MAEEVGVRVRRAIAGRSAWTRPAAHRSVRAALARRRRRAHRARVRRARRGARRRAHDRVRAVPVRRRRQQVPPRRVRGRPRDDPGDARRPLRRDAARSSTRAGPTATTTASPASDARVTRAYLDHASTSPLRPAALEAMLPFLREHHGDPGGSTPKDARTRVAVEDAREQVAALLRRPAARGGVHVERHRGREHRRLGRAGTGRRRRPHRDDRGRALGGARRACAARGAE